MNATQADGQYCPYLVVAIFAARMPQIVGRTYNRVDAEAQVRFLQRQMKNGSFFVAFEPEPQPTK
jgi:hypothetical protein